jgi:hypothetical protein
MFSLLSIIFVRTSLPVAKPAQPLLARRRGVFGSSGDARESRYLE